MQFSSIATPLGLLLIAIAPSIAIPPEDFGFPSAPNDTALTVAFQSNGNTIVVEEGELFGAGITAQAPTLAVSTAEFESLANYTGSYVIIMVDPDAHYPQDPDVRFFLHWLAPNMTRSSAATTANLSAGNIALTNTSSPFVPYTEPAPPTNSSAHRYLVYAFDQPSDFAIPTAFQGFSSANRTSFNLTNFIAAADLGTPAAAQYFYVSNETDVPQTFTAAGTATYPGGDGAMITSGTGTSVAASVTATGSSSSNGGESASGASATTTASTAEAALTSIPFVGTNLVGAGLLLGLIALF